MSGSSMTRGTVRIAVGLVITGWACGRLPRRTSPYQCEGTAAVIVGDAHLCYQVSFQASVMLKLPASDENLRGDREIFPVTKPGERVESPRAPASLTHQMRSDEPTDASASLLSEPADY